GLKKYTSNITAIFTMFDSGGSSGLLRDEFGYLPPGDIRRGILALSPESSETKMLRSLFNYRFTKGNGLTGHNFGNLLLTALKEITGDELAAIYEASKLCNIKGKVLPITLDKANLCAELENGQIIVGETNIDIPKHDATLKIKKIYLDAKTHILADAVEAILNAEVIVLGPGDLFTSLIPNLLVEGTKEAIRESKAKKVFVCNLMTKNGETNDFKASDFLETLERYLGVRVIQVVIANDGICSKEVLKKYELEHAKLVELDEKIHARTDITLMLNNFIQESDIVRHDSSKIAKTIIELN
ncbi:MAG: YvcK family protein, partial [Candidatus Staskawiczbacteria bacterium]|nr:YvcK family protein [Candidatus Staskawiczbacteria bacterium]